MTELLLVDQISSVDLFITISWTLHWLSNKVESEGHIFDLMDNSSEKFQVHTVSIRIISSVKLLACFCRAVEQSNNRGHLPPPTHFQAFLQLSEADNLIFTPTSCCDSEKGAGFLSSALFFHS